MSKKKIIEKVGEKAKKSYKKGDIVHVQISGKSKKKKTRLDKLKELANKHHREILMEVKKEIALKENINKKIFKYVELLKKIEEEIIK